MQADSSGGGGGAQQGAVHRHAPARPLADGAWGSSGGGSSGATNSGGGSSSSSSSRGSGRGSSGSGSGPRSGHRFACRPRPRGAGSGGAGSAVVAAWLALLLLMCPMAAPRPVAVLPGPLGPGHAAPSEQGRALVGAGGALSAIAAAASGGRAAPSPWPPSAPPPVLATLMGVPMPQLPPESVAAAETALAAARREAASPAGVTIGGLFGLTLEEQVLMARLAGQEVRGSFDAVGGMSKSDPGYWRALDEHLNKTTTLKHMYESTWYKCSKLSNGMAERYPSIDALEAAAHAHIVAWLGLREHQIPPHGATASLDQLVSILDSINASARIVTDPLPFLATQRVPTDRNGLPLLIHMTLRDKASFSRHHVLSIASWSRANPDYALLMFDDSDLRSYLSHNLENGAELFDQLKTPVERADLWRYVVMCTHGGVYADADTLCVRPVQEWNRENGHDAEVFFGVEDVFRRDPLAGDSGWGQRAGLFGVQFEQWALASAPGHPVHCGVARRISERIASEARSPKPRGEDNWSILHRTGPHVWTDAVLAWTHGKGVGYHEGLQTGGRLVGGGARVMPGETFGCAARFFNREAKLDQVYVMHMFRGGWRKRLANGGLAGGSSGSGGSSSSSGRSGGSSSTGSSGSGSSSGSGQEVWGTADYGQAQALISTAAGAFPTN
ncbi:alpha-1,6-mannosyltransferase subunit [Raphidocelis subcapitata]|uniref:Alpha-1,6-mannosyltransferase subunit n=1 Tax=Raphidocelis subcapitata TaxID=307507 RepID=A0A2V0NZF3_9CHLO|nr:alpha-1,6-mannosyltransferase subunit [Raphidocelis subcapitata]|eukprot:GBF90195.1 alpha-1,6-mannosyltransferase subunit [Raphidocelis subcapitata]